MFKSKYLKYKTKYLNSIRQQGSGKKDEGGGAGSGKKDEGGGAGKDDGEAGKEKNNNHKSLTEIFAKKMGYAPKAKELLGEMLGIGPSSRQAVPQENPDTLIMQVEAVGSRKVIIPELKLIPSTTLNDIKREIFKRNTIKTIRNFQAYKLLFWKTELKNPYQELMQMLTLAVLLESIKLANPDKQMSYTQLLERVFEGPELPEVENPHLLFKNNEMPIIVVYDEEKDNAIELLKGFGAGLQYASREQKNDKDIVMTAVTQDGIALAHASRELMNDRDIVMTAVTQNGIALAYASREQRNDRDIVMKAVTQNGRALEFASSLLQDDREIVMAAVGENRGALDFASDRLKNAGRLYNF